MKIELDNIAVPYGVVQRDAIFKEIESRGIKSDEILKIEYLKRSIDSRKRDEIKFIYSIEAELKTNINISEYKGIKESKEIIMPERKPKKNMKNIIVVGSGPAGLFAALRLAEMGLNPTLIERGKDVDRRSVDVEKFWSEKKLNKESNMQFGEGGAGTFSDGKLTTRIKSEYIEKVFTEMVSAGASGEILYDYKPHIGTDVLVKIVKNIREKIIKLGGKVLFETKLTDITIKNGKIDGIVVNKGEKIDCEHLILAIGHSARETFKMIHSRGIHLENKDFAVGVRIEHPQEIINKMQYGKNYGSNKLPPATYGFTYNSPEEKRGVFSFCMCPGGVVVNAASEDGGTLVNGMSYSKRDGKFANSAVVVSVGEKDYGKELFAGMKYQEKIERAAYDSVGGHGAVWQKLTDFRKGIKSKGNIATSFTMGMQSVDLNKFLPPTISKNMEKAFKSWENNRLFINDAANLIGPETRTSAPVRIKRDEKSRSVTCENLYPIGEGAGYAGGITSAAVDGIKCVDLNFTEEK